MKAELKTLLFPGIAVLTLGLAPYVPEPHVWKQIMNISHGTFTEPLDWFDLALHGLPWIWLSGAMYRTMIKKP